MNKIKKAFYKILIIIVIASGLGLYGQNKTEYMNPILAGFFPDPTICRVDDNYYLVNSTFAYYPGLPIFLSKDLVNWKIISYALNRPEQLNLDSAGVSRGLFAPTLRYDNGIFYLICTLIDRGGNFIVTAKNPAGPWSDPIWLPQLNGIDPSLFFDDNGKSYIVYNSVPPDDKPLYDGHRTIRMYEFDHENMKIKGEETILVNGGVNINDKPVWIEAPHILKKDGAYYLICAEGGTAYNHSEVVFKSDKAEGPYVAFDKNPILTQRTLNPDRPLPITSTGHADFVQTQKGDWWAVFLGCRPYEDDYYNLGRETFLAPVTWKDGWPVIVENGELVKYSYPLPLETDKNFAGIALGGDIEYTDNFDSDVLDMNWQFLRTVRETWYSLSAKKGSLELSVRPETCSGNMNPSFVCRRQQHNNSSATTALLFDAKSENEKAGLVIFQNETHYYFICKSVDNNEPVVQLYKSGDKNDELELLVSKKINKQNTKESVYLNIESKGKYYSFSYGFDQNKMILLKDSVDGKFLSTKTAGGFVGCMYALYSTSLGKKCANKAYFDWFRYKGKNEIK